MMDSGKSRRGLIYRMFRAYVHFFHDMFFYRHVYRIGTENIPSDGTPLLIASNHQNCLCDPLGVLFAFKDRKLSFIVRADVFSVHPLISKILRKMGLLPAYRLNFEGEASLAKNKEIFNVSERELVSGRTLLMYPEGTHQNKRWLGDFSLGYMKMAFEAAELDNFQTEIYMLPACNHYSGYCDIQQDILVRFGTPISLQPYYELYKTKPRTAQRRVNAIVREQIESMMLNIEDSDNYRAIDFLRNTYGRKYAATHGFRVGYLPDMLLSDRSFFEALDKAKSDDDTSVQQIYDDALMLEDGIKKLKIRDNHLEKAPGRGMIIAAILAMIALLPVWLFSLWPNIIIYRVPALVMRHVEDKMFYNSFLLGISVLITMPVLYTLSFILALFFVDIWISVLYVLMLPWLGIFAWYYWKCAVRTWQDICYRKAERAGQICSLAELRDKIYERLNNMLSKNE
jgi:1-acyl-sn-glycerol-3-phosphate acyltransferase